MNQSLTPPYCCVSYGVRSMIRPSFFITFFFLSWQSFAQEGDGAVIKNTADSIRNQFQSKKTLIDSLSRKVFTRPEDISDAVTSKTDSLNPLKIPTAKYIGKSDSLEQAILGKIEKQVATFNQKIDSLNKLRLPSTKYKQKADSLYKGFQQKVLSKYKLPSDTLSLKIKDRISELDKTISDKTSFLDSLFTANGLDMNFNLSEKFNPAVPQTNLPSVKDSGILPMPNTLIPNVPAEGLPQARAQLPGMELPNAQIPNGQIPNPNLPKANLPKTDNIPGMRDIKSLQEKVSDVTNVVKDAGKYAEEIKKVQEMDVRNLEKVPELAEKQLMKMDEMEAVQGELTKGEALKKEIGSFGDKAMNPEEVKEEIMHRTKQPFVDYLKGHEEKVQSGMNKIFDYQKKYRTVADTRYLPKRTANKMKGKPWQERLVPGISFHVNKNHQPWTGIDISPFIGYRLSGRFRTFVGTTYRPYMNIKTFDLNSSDKALAFRWFTHVKVINGVYVHLETERKKEYMAGKPNHQPFSDQSFNRWQNRYCVGLMRLQAINKKVNGAFYALYYLEDIGKTFNVSQVEMRFGFEYKLKKKKKLSAGK